MIDPEKEYLQFVSTMMAACIITLIVILQGCSSVPDMGSEVQTEIQEETETETDQTVEPEVTGEIKVAVDQAQDVTTVTKTVTKTDTSNVTNTTNQTTTNTQADTYAYNEPDEIIMNPTGPVSIDKPIENQTVNTVSALSDTKLIILMVGSLIIGLFIPQPKFIRIFF